LVPRGTATRAWRLSCSLPATSCRANPRPHSPEAPRRTLTLDAPLARLVPVGLRWRRHILLTSSGWRSRCRPSGPHAQYAMSSSRRSIGTYSVSSCFNKLLRSAHLRKNPLRFEGGSRSSFDLGWWNDYCENPAFGS
jgi:hypothetical protein